MGIAPFEAADTIEDAIFPSELGARQTFLIDNNYSNVYENNEMSSAIAHHGLATHGLYCILDSSLASFGESVVVSYRREKEEHSLTFMSSCHF